MAPHWQQSPAAPRPRSAPLSQAVASWQMETSNGWLTLAHKPDVMVEIGSLQDPRYRKEAEQSWFISWSPGSQALRQIWGGHGRGDHNGKGKSRHVLRGQGCFSWERPLNFALSGFLGPCGATQPLIFGTMCQLRSFPCWVTQWGQGRLFAPVPWQLATTHGPAACAGLPEMMTAALSHCLMLIVCDSSHPCSLQWHHSFLMSPQPCSAKGKV